MLRAVLLCIGMMLPGVSLLAVLASCPARLVLPLISAGIVLTAGILFERGRYKPATPEPPRSGWAPTDERFVDPTTGETVTVFYQPATGERRYVTQRTCLQCVTEE